MTRPWSSDPDPYKREIARQQEAANKPITLNPNTSKTKTPRASQQNLSELKQARAYKAAGEGISLALIFAIEVAEEIARPKTDKEKKETRELLTSTAVVCALGATGYAIIHYPFYAATAAIIPMWGVLKAGMDYITDDEFPVATDIIAGAITATSLYFGANYINDNFNSTASVTPETLEYSTNAIAYNQGSGVFAQQNTNLYAVRSVRLTEESSDKTATSNHKIPDTTPQISPIRLPMTCLV